MTHPILVAVSEGDEAQSAIDLGVMAARLLGAPLVLVGVVVSVAPGGATVVPGWTPAADRTMLRDYVARELHRHADAVPDDVPCTIHVETAASALHGIEIAVEETEAQLLVVGASHLGPFARAARGDVGAGAIRHAGCSVLIAPEGAGPGLDTPPTRIVAGSDDSAGAEVAVALARQVAIRAGAELEVVRAEDGEAASALVEASRRCDLLVLGAERPHGLAALHARHVSTAVLHHARCPVLVVPVGARVPAPA